MVLAVNKSYFTDKNYYINHDRWLNLWRESTGDCSITQVDVRKAKVNDYKQVDTIEYAYMVNYNWLKNKYDTSKIRELTEEEKQKFNKNLINDIDIEE